MKTLTKYYDDIYLDHLSSKVISSTLKDDYYYTVLDETIFFPEGGGMLADKGSINGIELINVIKKDNVIYHLSKEKLFGDVELRLDLDNRIRAIQNHDAQHLLTAIFEKDYHLDTISHHVFDNYCDIILTGEIINQKIIDEVQTKANNEILNDTSMEIFYVDKNELNKYGISDNPKYSNPVRITNIITLNDYNACGCLHFSSLKSLQSLVILGYENTSRGFRVTYTVGKNLTDYFSTENIMLKKLYTITKSNQDNIITNISNILEKSNQVSKEYNEIKTKYYASLVESKLNGSDKFFIIDEITNPKDLKNISLNITKSDKDIAALLQANTAESYSFILVKSPNSSTDIEVLFNKIKQDHNIKGGGKGLSISGQSNLDLTSIINKYI
jgi:alanyl-tRNA synthetase